MIKTSTPADTDTGAAIIAQLLSNDKQNLTQDENAVLNSGISEGMVVKWSVSQSKWLICDGTVALLDTDSIGVVTYADGTSGQVKTSGVYVNDDLSTVGKYYCQSDGSIGTTITKVFVGNITSPGRLCLPGGGGGGGNIATTTSLGQVMIGNGINVDSSGKISSPHGNVIYTTPGTYTWTCPTGVTSVLATVIGAGGGGGATQVINNSSLGGAGGAGGEEIRDYPYNVTPGNSYTVVVGAGGTGGNAYNATSLVAGAAGGNSSFDSLIANGGASTTGITAGQGANKLGYYNTTTVNGDVTTYSSEIITNSGQAYTINETGGIGGGKFGGSAGSASVVAGNGGIGSGGGGAAGKYDGGTTYQLAGNGGPGMVIIKY